MSETKQVMIPKDTIRKLKNIAKKFSKLNTGAIGDDFWIATGGGGGYEWSQFDIGINKKGELLTCEQSGCSCNGPDEPWDNSPQPLDGEVTFEDGYDNQQSEAVEDLIPTVDTLYKVLNSKAVTPQEIIGLPNAEVRRAVIELVGYEKLTDGALVKDESEVDGRLLVIKLQDDEDLNLLHVKDPSTTREYFLRVPPNMKTARQARAWTFGFEADEFELAKES